MELKSSTIVSAVPEGPGNVSSRIEIESVLRLSKVASSGASASCRLGFQGSHGFAPRDLLLPGGPRMFSILHCGPRS